MKWFLIITFFSCVGLAAEFDHQSFFELSDFSNKVQLSLIECANKERLKLDELYRRNLSRCDDATREDLKNLKDSFKMFTLSSMVNIYQQHRNKEKVSPLLIQLVAESISQFKLNETKQGGGNRGIGLCLGPLSIGICTSTPVFEIPPEIKEEHMAFLKLFDMIPETQCDLGLFPDATVTLINEIADAQGLVSERARNHVVVKGETMIFMAKNPNEDKPSSQLIKRLDGKFLMSCGLMPKRGSATSFFRSLVE